MIVSLRESLLKICVEVDNLARKFDMQIKCSNGREAETAETINMELQEKILSKK